MRFSCDKCSARYTIADEKVRGKVVAVRCAKCGNRISINGKSLDDPSAAGAGGAAAGTAEGAAGGAPVAAQAVPGVAAPLAPPAPEPLPDGWYVIVEGTQYGPLSGGELTGWMRAKKVGERTYAWRDGMGEWKRVQQLDALAAALAEALAPPPPPPPPAARPRNGSAPGAVAQPSAEQVAGALDKALFEAAAPKAVAGAQAPAGATEAGAGSSPAAGEEEKPPAEVKTTPFGTAPSAAELGPAADPFARVPDSPNLSKPGEIGEATRFFMKKAGVTNRNPAWKIALVAGLIVGVPLGVLLLLTQLRIVKLEVTAIDEQGQEVKRSVFSSAGFSGLRDQLLGKNKQKQKAGPAVAAAGPRPKKSDDDKPILERAKLKTKEMSEAEKQMMAGLLNDRPVSGPTARPELQEKAHLDGAEGGLDSKVIGEVFAKNITAFQMCNEMEIKRNPSFAGGKINITFTIGSSGVVTKAAIDRSDIDQSSLGSCIKDKAKRLAFPSFQGDPFDVEIPLVLTKGF